MNVRTLCLSILYDCDATGYEIRKLSIEGDCAYFVDASFGSIYPALSRLEDEGLVTSRLEVQDGRPSKKIYAITEAGRAALRDELFHDLGGDVFRSEFLLFARFASILPKSLIETRVRERLAALDKQLDELNQLKARGTQPGDAWVLDYGITCTGVARNYLRSHMHELIALGRPDAETADAAE